MNGRAFGLIALVFLVSAVAFAAACSDDADEPSPTATPGQTVQPTQPSGPDEVQLTDADDGSTVTLAKGGTLIVALPSNPTTGYSWSVSEQSSPELELQGEPRYVPAGSTTPVVGAGGTEVFTFEAVDTGDATLTLEYRRPFEPGAAPAETFSVTVQIR